MTLSNTVPHTETFLVEPIYQIIPLVRLSWVRSDLWDVTHQEVWGDMLLLGSSFLPIFSGIMSFTG